MLSGKELVKRAKEAHQKHPEAFEALLEYERTGRLYKPNPKIRVNFTIDAKVMKEFRVYCRKHGHTMSALVEKYMEKKLKNEST